ncbi:OmpA family protein [Tabrizicola sp.]|uniref:OmpA family protein n=1 Tax=Tabrizicola sp. TaxID=2005166 RepID=UPI003F2E0228
MIRHTLHGKVPAALLCLAMAAPVQAQNPLTDPAPGTTTEQPTDVTEQQTPPGEPEDSFGGTDLSATDIIRELAPVEGNTARATREVQTPSGIVVMDTGRAVDLTVFFAYDSDRLLPEARAQLDALGYALNDPALRPYSFLIAGHTDARGSAAYNLELSIRRAIAVADYLVRYHNISPDRLVAHGWGEEELKVPSDPMSGANRRVEVSLLVPMQTGYYQPVYPLPGQIVPGIEYSYVVVSDPGSHWGLHWSYTSGLSDPRWRLSSNALDDFHATPTWLHN